MKGRWKRVILLVYVILLALSHVYRQVQDAPGPLPGQEATTVLGDRLAFRESGAAEGPTLLLIHGSPTMPGIFAPLAAQLEGEFPLLIPDLPGFGRSEQRVEDLSIEAHAHYLAKWLRQRDLENVIPVGYSMGGGVAIHLAHLAPERISGLVLLASIGVQEHELLGDYVLNHAIHGLQLAAITLIQEGVPHFGWWDSAMLNRNYARNFYETDQRPLRSLLETWTGPTLIIQGEHDRLVPGSAAREHHRIVPQSQLVWIEGGNHIDLMRRPAEVAAPIARFAREPGPRRSGATLSRVVDAERPAELRRLDGSPAGAVATMLLLGIATLASEDLACISGGLLTSRGVLHFATAVAGCLAGIFLGDITLFLLGKWLGPRALERAPLRWIAPKDKIDSGRRWLDANGAKVIIATRFIPGSRLPVYVGMGAAGVCLKKFLFWFLLAAAIWTPILVGLSAVFGHVFLPWFEDHENYIIVGLLGLVGALLLVVRGVSILSDPRQRRLFAARWDRRTRWEFWPAWILYLALLPHAVFLALRHRSATVFAAANPALPCGGFAHEPKRISLEALRESGNLPAFALVSSAAEVKEFMHRISDPRYPIVLKPVCGERGKGVAIVHSDREVEEYFAVSGATEPVVAQQYVEGPEFGVFYYRHPEDAEGRIFSITRKKSVSVVGDGRSTIEELILSHPRARLMADFFLRQFRQHLGTVPAQGERLLLSRLGTHSRGALFLSGDDLITPRLTREIDRIARSFAGFHFGRFDLKAPSEEELRAGRGILILELNGVTSEATAIYDPDHTFSQALAILRRQWELCYEIGAKNRARGCPEPSFLDLWGNIKAYQAAKRFEAPLR